MPSYLVRVLREQMRLPIVDEASIDTFLAPAADKAEHAILFFTGDPALRPEADDVAVVLPELLRAFPGRVRGAIVLRAAEDKLKPRFNVVVMPSLVVTRGAQPLGVIGKIRDWSEYMEKIGNWLSADAPVMAASGGSKVEITHAGNQIAP